MPSAERTIAIRRPVEQVYRFVSDARTATQWRASADYEITALEPDQRVAFRTIAGRVRPTGEFVLEAMGDATILTLRLRATLSWRRGMLLGRLVQASLDGELRALDALQELLER